MNSANHGIRILLVEDSEALSDLAVELLCELGHDIAAVRSAESALEALGERTFDAVMTDVRLPGMSGIDLAVKVIERYPRMPIVVSSACDEYTGDLLQPELRANVYFLPKPYDLDMLQRVFDEASQRPRP